MTLITGTRTLAAEGMLDRRLFDVLAEEPLAGCELDQWESCRLQAALPAESSVYTLRASMRRQVPNSALSTAGGKRVGLLRAQRTRRPQPRRAPR
ncbi:hypothetical protein [Nonomuraea sp. JJY05]|uniref:hypothetical protein n=1 Tax=Nonomuraea sp. JJY05 TaxID=3350255 RepID=UPI00373E4EFA